MMLEEIKKKNDKKFAEIQEKEEFLKKEKFYKALDKKKKRQGKDQEVKKLQHQHEQELILLEQKFNEVEEVRKENERKKKRI